MTKVEKWTVLDTGLSSAERNMQLDAELLEALDENSTCILHLYEWEGPSATYGHFVDPFTLLQKENVEKRGLKLAKRPTGGGIIFHLWDYAFSVLVPSHSKHFSQNTLENYAFVNEAVLMAAKEFLRVKKGLELIQVEPKAVDEHTKRFCMALPTKYDVMLNGRKIAGAAQRKTKKGFLHQGSISLMLPSREFLEDVLMPGTEVLDSMFAYTFPLMGDKDSNEDLASAREEIKQILIREFTQPKDM